MQVAEGVRLVGSHRHPRETTEVGLGDMLDVDPDAAVTDELRTVLTATTPAGRVGLDGHPPPAAVAAEAHRRLAAAQQRTLATRSAAEDAALVTLIRTYTALAAGH